MAVGDGYVFPGFLTPVLTQLFFPKPPTTFLTCFCRGERRKYAGNAPICSSDLLHCFDKLVVSFSSYKHYQNFTEAADI